MIFYYIIYQLYIYVLFYHTLRNSVKYVEDKDMKAVCRGLRSVNSSSNLVQAVIAFETFRSKWDAKYPEISKIWEKDWVELTN